MGDFDPFFSVHWSVFNQPGGGIGRLSMYLDVKIIGATLGARDFQHGKYRNSLMVGDVEGLRGPSLPSRTAHTLPGTGILRFCRTRSAVAQGADSGEHDWGTGASQQRIDYGGNRPFGTKGPGRAV